MRSIKNQIFFRTACLNSNSTENSVSLKNIIHVGFILFENYFFYEIFFFVVKPFSNWCKIYITSIISISKSVVHSWNHYWFLLMFSVHLKIIVERYVYWFLKLIIVFIYGNYRGFYKNDEKLIYTIFRFDNSLNFASSLLTIDY